MEWLVNLFNGFLQGLGYFLVLILLTMLVNKIVYSLKKERQDKVVTWMDKVTRDISKFEKAFWENRYLLLWIFLIISFSLQTYK